MNRELKFRAWDTTKKKMHHEISLMFANDLNGVFEGLNECGCIVMQYIGKKDKNGVEIYEGDIVRVINNYFRLQPDFTGVVVFRDCIFAVESEDLIGYDWISYEVEILGNIHENPELLEDDE